MSDRHGHAAHRSGPDACVQAAAAADNDNQMNILLVEDDYIDSLLTIQTVNASQIPYNLNRITRGDEVLPYFQNCLQTRLPDLLLLDMGLPGMDGAEILEVLARAPAAMRAVPIVIVTGCAPVDYRKKNELLPIYGLLEKPLRLEVLQPILTRVADFRN